MNWYQLSAEETEQQLHVSHKTGLTYDQVLSYQNTFGKNIVEQKEKVSNWFIFIKQFQDFMVLILLGATLIAGLLGEFIDATAILVIVLINGFIGFFQEFRAENSLEKLRELSAPTTYVLREGHWERVPSAEIVVGDIIRLTRGDRISADVRIIKSHGLETEESALTGESIPITKETSPIQTDDLDPQDQTNMAFMGTVVSRGSGIGIVVQTGMNTMMGKIATLMTTTEQKTTPLENRLIHLGKILIVIVLALTAMIVAIGVIQGNPLYHMFLAGISLAVAAIPEGLPAIVTVALSLGVQRMIKRKSIVRKLSAVETLGCATIICSDKTGTITENEMTVKQIFLNDEIIHVSGDGYQLDGHFYQNEEEVTSSYPNLASMLTYGMICNHANIVIQKGKYKIDGDPTDGALLVAARKFGLKEKIREQYTIIKEIPFDAHRKRMSMIVEDENKLRFLIVKGAPDVLLSKCRYVRIKKGQKELTDQTYYERAVEQMARRSLRTIAIAIKPILKSSSLIDSELENDLTLLGIYGMIDPPRKEVKQAIANCKKAGIQTVMITGDHIDTAQAIATEIELLPKHGEVISGTELNNLSTAELKERVDNIYVYARVTPEHKLKIVKALQEKGHVVAMTGDGVNDAPAIKASDIGISMGLTGTDVTKEASSLILMDDNFSTIEAAIREGRNIYENIRKFIRYLLASNVGEILVMLLAILFAYPLPLVPVQILWVNLVTDGLPAIALGVDKPEGNVMKRSPRDPQESVFARGLGMKILSRGFFIGVVSLIGFIIAYDGDQSNLTYARTIAFTTLVIAQLIHVFDCRSETSIFMRNPFENLYLVLSVISSLLLMLVVIYWSKLQPIFHTTPLQMKDWFLIIVLSLIPTIVFNMRRSPQ
ncbi:MAG TPA: cation-translocating P-type ATPase [Bacillota bacterium]|nr:cation-translocating P-type ATPase [Bacillota bacterium]